MTLTIDSAVVEAKIKALYTAYNELVRSASSTKNEPALPWRDDERIDYVAAIKQAMNEIADEIVDLEHSLRDPIQDAEMRAEINASIGMYGNWNDCADDYLHTPMQERLYQESIERSAQYAYDDERGDYNPIGSCGVCNATVNHEDSIYVCDFSTCYHCNDEATLFAYLLAFITNTSIEQNYWGEINYVTEDN
jgi:hypothetical protein